jgi:hypothetical protein
VGGAPLRFCEEPAVEEPAVDGEALAAPFAAAFVCEAVLPEEPPHAVKPTLASAITATTPAAGVRRAFFILVIELLFR